MRLKKQKRHRKSVRFFTACFGFREPFKVLCDGTFVHHLVSNQITPADQALSNVLGAPVKLFTTNCVLGELKSLGESHTETLKASHNLIVARCEHEKRKRADLCIMDVIGENNSEHFFVATQDIDLRKKFQEVPGVPLVFGLRNALFLEPPSAFQRQYVKAAEEQRLHMSESEYIMLRKKKNGLVATKEATNVDDADEDASEKPLEMQAVKKAHTPKRGTNVEDKPQFKRKRAKGPNPLSCKKKKNSGNPSGVGKKEKKDDDSSAKSRTRKRNRTHKGTKPADAGSYLAQEAVRCHALLAEGQVLGVPPTPFHCPCHSPNSP